MKLFKITYELYDNILYIESVKKEIWFMHLNTFYYHEEHVWDEIEDSGIHYL